MTAQEGPQQQPHRDLVNRRLSVAVSINRCHADYAALKGNTRFFLQIIT